VPTDQLTMCHPMPRVLPLISLLCTVIGVLITDQLTNAVPSAY
jgi:hypothetical protein